MDESEVLEQSIKSYNKRLREHPSVKEESLAIDFAPSRVVSTSFIMVLQRMFDEAEDAIERFAIAKHGLHLHRSTSDIAESQLLIPKWLRACSLAGAYNDCIKFSEIYFESPLWDHIKLHRESVSIYLEYAKSLRNIGSHDASLSNYRKAMSHSETLKHEAGISTCFLLIGKLYGNYLGQKSLFASFVEEAKGRLERIQNEQGSKGESDQYIHHLAICHDALGQAYLKTEEDRALEHFRKAISLNKSINRQNGITRSLCHMNEFQFWNRSKDERETHLAGFQEGLRLLMQEPMQERGLGIRWCQFASMLHEIGDHAEAKYCLKRGKKIASQYSDYRTLTRAAVIESEIYMGSDKSSDRDYAVVALLEGLKVAHDYGLIIHESEINRRLAALSSIQPGEKIQSSDLSESDKDNGEIVEDGELKPHTLFARNRRIYKHLIEQVNSGFTRLNSEQNLEIEYRLLSSDTRQTFREKLLIDFAQVVNQLDANLVALTNALRLTEDRNQGLLMLEAMQFVIRNLMHDIKHQIPKEEKDNPLVKAAEVLKAICLQLGNSESHENMINLPVDTVTDIITQLDDHAGRIRLFNQKMVFLKQLLTEQIKKVEPVDVSLKEITLRILSELKEQYPAMENNLKQSFDCDIIVRSDKRIMTHVLKHLLRNAIEAIDGKDPWNNPITIHLGFEYIDGNSAREAIIRVMNHLTTENEVKDMVASIECGLEGVASRKRYGSGVGLEVAQAVFVKTFRGKLEVINSIDPPMSGIIAKLRAGNDIRIVTQNKQG